jgi:hypothetical protein
MNLAVGEKNKRRVHALNFAQFDGLLKKFKNAFLDAELFFEFDDEHFEGLVGKIFLGVFGGAACDEIAGGLFEDFGLTVGRGDFDIGLGQESDDAVEGMFVEDAFVMRSVVGTCDANLVIFEFNLVALGIGFDRIERGKFGRWRGAGFRFEFDLNNAHGMSARIEAGVRSARGAPKHLAGFERLRFLRAIRFRDHDLAGIEVNHDAIHFVFVRSAHNIGRGRDEENAGVRVIDSDVVRFGGANARHRKKKAHAMETR